MQFIVAPEDKIKVETFDGGVAKGSNKAGVGSMVDFATKLLIFFDNFGSHSRDITHL